MASLPRRRRSTLPRCHRHVALRRGNELASTITALTNLSSVSIRTTLHFPDRPRYVLSLGLCAHTIDLPSSLARSKGFLDQFYCKGCESTLADIVSARRPGWSSFELWCGSEACLGASSDLKPCARYARSLKAGYAIDDFLGYRNLVRNEVKCARCFFLCPACESERRRVDEISLIQSDQDEEDAEASDDALLSILDEFLPPRGRTFEYPDTPTPSDSGDSTSQPDQHIQSPQGRDVPEPSVAILEETQGTPELGVDVLSAKEETEADWGIRFEYPSVPFHRRDSDPTCSPGLTFQTLRSPSLSSEPIMDDDMEMMPLPEGAEDEASDSENFLPLESFYEELDEVVKESGVI